MAAPAAMRPTFLRTCVFLSKDVCTKQQGIMCCSKFHTSSTVLTDEKKSLRAQKISAAMQMYLIRAKEHEKFVIESEREYDLGKRHLANIMGVDPDEFTHEHIKRAIEYLLPSGLHNKEARPMFRHPSEILPRTKAASFNWAGRPHHYMFYTRKPNYYSLMSEISGKIENLKAEYLQSRKIKKDDEETPKEEPLDLARTKWIDKLKLRQICVDDLVSKEDHRRFTVLMDHLANQKLARREIGFIMSMREELTIVDRLRVPPLHEEKETGRLYSDAMGRRKTSWAKVRVYADGAGVVDINGQGIDYFEALIHRKAVLFPLSFLDVIEKVDIHCTCWGGGLSGQAGAIRQALSLALQAHTSEEMLENMQYAGLLTLDIRRRERKKAGKHKARKAHTWKPR